MASSVDGGLQQGQKTDVSAAAAGTATASSMSDDVTESTNRDDENHFDTKEHTSPTHPAAVR